MKFETVQAVIRDLIVFTRRQKNISANKGYRNGVDIRLNFQFSTRGTNFYLTFQAGSFDEMYSINKSGNVRKQWQAWNDACKSNSCKYTDKLKPSE